MSEFSGEKSEETGRQPVVVATDSTTELSQPDHFQLCPLGLQFYSEEALVPFSVMSVDIEVPEKDGSLKKIACTGAVVRCQRETNSNRYRVWLQFLEMPEGTRENLKCTAKAGNFLCSYCCNF